MEIDFKYILVSVMFMGFICDVFEVGLMTIGIFLGWLVGLGTMSQWEERRKKNEN